MINSLDKLGLEPQAIEQPLDLEIPENKIMLAFYLAAPEVENDRRALNIIVGMRRAKRDGRWMGRIPHGYVRARDEMDKPIIVPNEEAPLIVKSFKLLAKGLHPVEEAWRIMEKQGLKISKNQFWDLIQNPVYIGKIFISEYKDEEAQSIIGIHKPLVTEELFNTVQDFIHGRRKNLPLKYCKRNDLPLRGYLVCPRCGKNLTGSASKGNGGKYFYYHCLKGCKERVKAETVNRRFLDALSTISANKNIIDYYYEAIHDLFKSNAHLKVKNVKRIREEVKQNEEQILKAQQFLLEEKIDSGDYKNMKKRYEKQNNDLIRKEAQLSVMDAEYKKYLDWDFSLIRNLPKGFEKADLEQKQKIVGSIFPERMVFSKNQFRTKKMNRVIQLISQNTNEKSKNKKDLALTLSAKSDKVELWGKVSNLFPEDLVDTYTRIIHKK